MEVEPPPVQRESSEERVRQEKQVIADVLIGVNLRKKDNLYQGIAVLAGSLLGLLIGFLWGYAGSRSLDANLIGPCLLGFLGGAIVSLLISGGVLAVYRLIHH